MKLLVSDYDGTLASDVKNLFINIKCIKKFIDSGNKFVISTGRSFDSIKEQIKKFDIPYDYLTCNDGLITFDNQDNILFSHTINEDIIESILCLLYSNNNFKKIILFNQTSNTPSNANLLEIMGKCKNINYLKMFKNILEKEFFNIELLNTFKTFYIRSKEDKSTAIEELNALLNINHNDIYTVGDDKNDLSMLKDYNGYRVLYSCPSLWNKNIPITREVHTLVKRINHKD